MNSNSVRRQLLARVVVPSVRPFAVHFITLQRCTSTRCCCCLSGRRTITSSSNGQEDERLSLTSSISPIISIPFLPGASDQPIHVAASLSTSLVRDRRSSIVPVSVLHITFLWFFECGSVSVLLFLNHK